MQIGYGGHSQLNQVTCSARPELGSGLALEGEQERRLEYCSIETGQRADAQEDLSLSVFRMLSRHY